MKQLMFLLSISSLLFFSCAKEGKNIYIEGRVINPVTGEGISNIKMELWKDVIDIGGSGSNSKIVKEVLSDENGNYVIAHNGSPFNSYSVRPTFDVAGKGFHRVGWRDQNGTLVSQFSLEVQKTKYMNLNLELLPLANIKFEFNNINCIDSNDELRVYLSDNYSTYLPNAWIHNGCVNFVGNGGALQPMGYYYVQWDVERNSVSNTFYDTIYLAEDELKTYVINY